MIHHAEVCEFSLTALPSNAGCVPVLKALDAMGDVIEITDSEVVVDITDDAPTSLRERIDAAVRAGIDDSYRATRRGAVLAHAPRTIRGSIEEIDVRNLDLDDDEIDIDPVEFRAALHEVHQEVIAQTVRQELNRLRGRVD